LNRLWADAESKYKEEQKRLENEAKAKANPSNQQNAEKKDETKSEDKMDVE